jgi:hypothetical protein
MTREHGIALYVAGLLRSEDMPAIGVSRPRLRRRHLRGAMTFRAAAERAALLCVRAGFDARLLPFYVAADDYQELPSGRHAHVDEDVRGLCQQLLNGDA